MSGYHVTDKVLLLLKRLVPAEIALAILDLAGFWARTSTSRHEKRVYSFLYPAEHGGEPSFVATPPTRNGAPDDTPYLAVRIPCAATRLRAVDFRAAGGAAFPPPRGNAGFDGWAGLVVSRRGAGAADDSIWLTL